MNINEIKEMIYNAAVDGHLRPLWAVGKYVEDLQRLQEEILMLVYNEGWNNDFEPIQYEDTLHFQFEERRRQIAERINTTIAQNQDCYIAYWVKQNPDKNLDDYTLVHGFKGEYYTFWLEHKSTLFGKYGRFEE